MSRLERLREYANPMKGPHGAASSEENLADWSARATSNSAIAPRAASGAMKLPSTGKRMNLRDSEMKPYRARGDARAEAKADLNEVGSSYMRGIRRNA